MKIMVGYIDTPEGHAALDRAVEEAKLRGAHLLVVHSMRGDEDAREFITSREQLAELEERLNAAGVNHETRQLARGVPAGRDLVEFADAEDVDLIVIGLRRRSAVGKLVLGSNAQDVIINADCPVLAVKTQ